MRTLQDFYATDQGLYQYNGSMPLTVLAALSPWLETLGRSHVVAVHFPIALLLLAGAIELGRVLIGKKEHSITAAVCLVFGAFFAIVSSISGWFHGSTFAPSAILTIHFYLGLATAAVSVLAICALIAARVKVYRAAVLVGALLVALTGHYGGSLTHGSGYLTEALWNKDEGGRMKDEKKSFIPHPSSFVSVHFPADGKIDFIRDVQPIFAQSCYECHGPQKRRGQLRLDNKRSTFDGGNSGPAVVPGKSAESVLIKRVLGQGIQKRMPVDHPPLNDEQTKILVTWIDQGANWPEGASSEGGHEEKHWAYVKPVAPQLPEVKDKSWPRNGIDFFVVARLEKEGLKPSAEADRTTLIRRVSLDLTGLPPTPEEVDAFVSDTRADAYERVVDRLLASPQYGEQWGRHWLDVARYADTNGYEKDNPRIIWPYRDWVINAINSDLPYDQFVIQQIAGDMLAGATPEQKIATGFHRNTMFNEEGGIDVEEFRFKAIVDRVQTTSTAFLGLTMQCAQCHNHKYDAISQRDYYRFSALLNNTDEPTYEIPDANIAAKRNEILAQIREIEKHYAENFPVAQPEPKWNIAEAAAFKSAAGASFSKLPDQSLLVSGNNPEKDTYTIEISADTTDCDRVRLEVLNDASLAGSGPGRAPNGNFVLTHFGVAGAAPVIVTSADADFSQDNFPISAAIETKKGKVGGKVGAGWAIDNPGKPVASHAAVFHLKDRLPSGVNKLTVTLVMNYGGQHTLGKFRLSVGKLISTPDSLAPIEQQRSNFLASKFVEWQASMLAKCSRWTQLDPVKFSRNHDATITKLDDHSLLYGGDNLYRDEYHIEYALPAQPITALRLEVLPHEDLPKSGPGRDVNGGFLLSEFTADISSRATTQASPIVFTNPSADISQDSIARAIDTKRDTHWTVFGGAGVPHEAVFPLKEKLAPSSDETLSVAILQNYHQSENLGRVRISITSDEHAVATGLPADIESILLAPAEARTPAQTAQLKQYFLATTPLLGDEHQKIAALKASMPAYQTTLVMQERAVQRPTYIHHRGEFLQPQGTVDPGVPAILPQLPKDEPANRLALAKWLVDPENPLVGRVTMNRMWCTYFGRGIVNTIDDFGVMGEKPSHPELLDYLATQLPRQHWSMKAMHKMIVMSATYRQASVITPELKQRDPQNVLLARGPRLRVDAENVRDVALAASGLLNEKIGGPSVFPPQPEGITDLSYGPMTWPTETGANRYRRGLYTYLKRTSPYPALIAFDGVSADLTCTRRLRSNTPLQALTTLNDAVFTEAAQALAKRIVAHGPSDIPGRITYAYRLCLARAPQEKELADINNFFTTQLHHFTEKPTDAIALAAVGLTKPPANVPELAAWTSVSRVILNLDETLTKE
jgi:uncharacterized membrane protein